jgi:hypothetical protein
MLSTVMPQISLNPDLAQGQGLSSAAGFKPTPLQGFGSTSVVEGDAAAAGRDQADQDVSRGSRLSDKDNVGNVSDRVQGLEPEVDESVARVGPWAVEALKPGGSGEKQPLLRQVVGDIASGRHPVTQ